MKKTEQQIQNEHIRNADMNELDAMLGEDNLQLHNILIGEEYFL